MMIVIIIGGIYGIFTAVETANYIIETLIVLAFLAYPGAEPEGIEERIIVRIEEAVYAIDDVKKLKSNARDSFG